MFFIFFLYLFKSSFTSNILQIPLENKLSSLNYTNQLFLNITTNYLIPLDTIWMNSKFNLNNFLSQLDAPYEAPDNNLESEIPNFCLDLNLLNLNKPIYYCFDSYIDALYSPEPDYEFFAERLSLPHDLIEPNSNLLTHQLSKAGLISNNTFILDLNSFNNNKYNLYLGGIPQELQVRLGKSYNVNQKQFNGSFWLLNIKQLSFGFNSYKLNYNCIINLFDNKIKVESHIFIEIINEVLGKFINNNKCSLRTFGTLQTVVCHSSVIENVPTFSWKIQNFVIKLNNNSLFNCVSPTECVFIIYSDHYAYSGNTFFCYVGYSLFNNILTVFDYEKDEVAFYSIYDNIKDMSHIDIQKPIIIFLILILLCAICLLYIKRNERFVVRRK